MIFLLKPNTLIIIESLTKVQVHKYMFGAGTYFEKFKWGHNDTTLPVGIGIKSVSTSFRTIIFQPGCPYGNGLGTWCFEEFYKEWCLHRLPRAKTIFNEMFVRMLAVHCDQNNSYKITMSGYQARKMNEIYFAYFSRLIITIILITINSQHSYKHLNCMM